MRKFNLANGIWLGGDAERVRATRRDAARHGASTVRAARGAAPCEQSRPPAERRAAAAAAAAGALPPLSVRRSPSPANSQVVFLVQRAVQPSQKLLNFTLFECPSWSCR